MSSPSREEAIEEAKADGYKFDRNNDEWYKPSAKSKKKNIAKKMFKAHGNIMNSMVDSMRGKKKKTSDFFKNGVGRIQAKDFRHNFPAGHKE
jgi:hypothetical protein